MPISEAALWAGATRECELSDCHRFCNITDERTEIVSLIDWYNQRRRHSALDEYPVFYEQTHHSAHAA